MLFLQYMYVVYISKMTSSIYKSLDKNKNVS